MKKQILTKAAKNVVEVIEIIISFFQHSLVPNSFAYLFVGLCHCAGAGRGWMKRNKRLVDQQAGVQWCASVGSKLQTNDSLAAVGVNNISKELHPHDGKGVVEDD